jgi:hypothetical protein
MFPLDQLDSLWDRLANSSWYDGEYVSQELSVIIGGCARSGTTLMRVMLDTHPNIYCGPESNLFTPIRIRTGKRIKELSWRFDISEQDIRILLDESRCLPEFIEKFFNHLTIIQGKKRWGEKTPTNVLRLSYIFRHFPHSRFIHMIRDGRDVACSLRNFPKSKIVDGKIIPVDSNNPIDKCMERWVHDVKVGRRWVGDPRYLEVKYENLVLKAEKTLKKVLDFLGEPYDEQVLKYYEVEGSTRDASKFPQNVEATKPLYTRSMGRWKGEFTDTDRALFKRIGGNLLIELGYEDNGDW